MAPFIRPIGFALVFALLCALTGPNGARGASENMSSRQLAAGYGEQQVVCEAIRQRHLVSGAQMNGRTLNFLLFDAASRGCLELVQRFIDEGASIEARDRSGNTALLLAARAGETKTVRFLLDAGADLHHRNLAGGSALLQAVTMNRRRTAKVLLAAGADPNIRTRRGVTALITAAYNGNGRIAEMLLAAGADPGGQDLTGKAAMIYAAGKGYGDILDMLLDAGVAVDARYGNNLTALMWAAGHTNDVPATEGEAAVRQLIEHGADVSLTDDRGWTALMIAAERGHEEIVSLLLATGADPTTRGLKGKTAAELAGNAAVRALLEAP